MFSKIISPVKKLLLHLHPTQVDERAIKLSRTFGLGGISALMFIMLFFSGLILRFSYVPTIEHAYNSIINLQNKTVFGHFIRSLHHLTAQLFIVTSILHLLRTYYSQSIFQVRSSNWLYGLMLLFLVFAFAFTGYLLPWDQLSYWAVTIFTQTIEYIPFLGYSLARLIRGGEEVGQTTLLLFYNLHTGILPILFIVFMSVHFWLVRKAGGLALPECEGSKKAKVMPNLVMKELLAAAVVIAVISILAVFYQTHINDQANPLVSSNNIKAPWYFLGLQELMLHFHPLVGLAIILCVVIYFLYLPFFRYKNLMVGVWFYSPQGKQIVVFSALFSFIYTFTVEYLLDHYIVISNVWVMSIVALLVYLVPVALFLFYWVKKHHVNREEIILSITTIIIISYLTLTLVALLLRGTGMELVI